MTGLTQVINDSVCARVITSAEAFVLQGGVAGSTGLTTPLAIPDGPLADMCRRIELPKLAAVETSAKIWPDRVQTLQDVAGYLQWHNKVCPGGDAHRSPVSRQVPDLSIWARSVNALSRTLILMLDEFHWNQMTPGQARPDIGLLELEGVRYDRITSLRPFFQPLRCYMM